MTPKTHFPKGTGYTYCGLPVNNVALTNRTPDCMTCRKLFASPIDPKPRPAPARASAVFIDIKDVVAAYIECGNRFGYAVAESILSRYSPPHVLDSKCYHVRYGKRAAFIDALKRGVKLKNSKLVPA